MRPRLKAIYRLTERYYREVYDELARLAEEVIDDKDKAELADTAYALRETGELLRRLRVRVEANQEAAERIACTLAVQSADIDPIRTPYCSATPDMKVNVRVPNRKREPDGYAELMHTLGVPEELWNRGAEFSPVVDIHWPGLVEWVTQRTEAGLPLPAGISADRTSTIFRLAIRRRRGVLEESGGE